MKYYKIAIFRGNGKHKVFLKFIEGISESAENLVEGTYNPKGLLSYQVILEIDTKGIKFIDLPETEK